MTPLLLARGPTPKEAAPDPSRPPVPTTPPSTAPAEPAATAQDRTLEFFLFGHTTLKSVTTTVNGHTVTLHDVKLPYRRVVVIPRSPQRSTWRIAYLIGKGEISWKVLVDDQEYGSGDSSSTNPDVKDHSDGVI